jgi:hypothetical protein
VANLRNDDMIKSVPAPLWLALMLTACGCAEERGRIDYWLASDASGAAVLLRAQPETPDQWFVQHAWGDWPATALVPRSAWTRCHRGPAPPPQGNVESIHVSDEGDRIRLEGHIDIFTTMWSEYRCTAQGPVFARGN